MEHAVEALKLAAAVIVFVLAVSLTYMIFSQTKATADSIFYIRDSQKYMEEENLENIVYITSTGVTTNRTVNMETIIPTLYRYHKENFGVTIVVKDDATGDYKILTRYDNTTENIVGTWDPTIEEGTPEEDWPSIAKHLDYLNEYVTIINEANPEVKEYTWSYSDLSNIYKVQRDGETGTRVATPWLNSEQGIASRISSDISGKSIKYNEIDTYNVNDGKEIKLLDYSDTQFIEYIKVIDNNIYVTEVGADDEELPTEFIQERLMAKTEIIYIEADEDE